MKLSPPAWLDDSHPAHKSILSRLFQHQTTIRDFTNEPVTLEDFELGPELNRFALSQFTASKDSLFYANLMAESLRRSTVDLIQDLGTGSAIPLISALRKSKSNARAVAIEIDKAAIEVARQNVDLAGMSGRIDFRHQSLVSFLNDADETSHQTCLVASNPPYMPCPGPQEGELLPVHGGPDGTMYLDKILNHRFSTSAWVAIQWGSVSNPLKVFDLIDRAFEIKFFQAWEVPFGKYSKMPLVNSYLEKQRELGKAVFQGQAPGEQTQLILGALLRPRELSKNA